MPLARGCSTERLVIALGNGHYDLKILRSLFRAIKKKHFRATVGSLAPRCPPHVLPEETSEVLMQSEVVSVTKVANN